MHPVSFVHKQVIQLCAAYFAPMPLCRVCLSLAWTLLRWAWLLMAALWLVYLLIVHIGVRKHCISPQWGNLSETNATRMIIRSRVPFGTISRFFGITHKLSHLLLSARFCAKLPVGPSLSFRRRLRCYVVNWRHFLGIF